MLLDFLDDGDTETAERYCDTLERLRQAIRPKRPGLVRHVIILHDDFTAYTANRTSDSGGATAGRF
jgi:hypothetical protein